MESPTTVVPAPGDVSKVCSTLVGMLTATDIPSYQPEAEDIREIRFVLRKIIQNLRKLLKSESQDKDYYLAEAREAGSSIWGQPQELNFSIRTSETVCKIITEAPWSLKLGTPIEQQELNVSLKGIRDGIAATIAMLSDSLEHGTANLEYNGLPASSPTAPGTPSRSVSSTQAPSTPSRRSSRGPGNFGHSKGRVWTSKEDLELLRVVRDMPSGTHGARTAEFNRRMAWQGVTDTRSREAFRLHTGILEKAGTTIADLERALAATA